MAIIMYHLQVSGVLFGKKKSMSNKMYHQHGGEERIYQRNVIFSFFHRYETLIKPSQSENAYAAP